MGNSAQHFLLCKGCTQIEDIQQRLVKGSWRVDLVGRSGNLLLQASKKKAGMDIYSSLGYRNVRGEWYG